MFIVAIFAALFAIFSDLGINDIGRIQTNVDYLNSVFCVMVFFFLRLSKNNFILSARLLLAILFMTFIVVLIYVPQDEFRLIWFYFVTYAAFILLGSTSGIFVSIVSIIIILTANYFLDLQLSQYAMITSLFGLIIFTLLSNRY